MHHHTSQKLTASVHKHRPGRDVLLVVLAESLPLGLLPDHAQLVAGVPQDSLHHRRTTKNKGQWCWNTLWWTAFLKLSSTPQGFWLAWLDYPRQDGVGSLHHLVNDWNGNYTISCHIRSLESLVRTNTYVYTHPHTPTHAEMKSLSFFYAFHAHLHFPTQLVIWSILGTLFSGFHSSLCCSQG